MMNKYTTLLQKYLKIIIFFTLVLGLFLVFGRLFQASSTLTDKSKIEVSQVRADFFTAMQEHDLAKARIAYEKLKVVLPRDDQFLTEIAPAYMADLYLKYANSLEYDKTAHDLMIAQARLLSPAHPKIQALDQRAQANQPIQNIAVQEEPLPPLDPTPEQPVAELILNHPPQMTEHPAPEQPKALSLSEQFPSVDEYPVQLSPQDEVKDGPPRIPYIDPPPLSAAPDPLLDISPDDLLVKKEPPKTNDPCALSYYSKDNPLAACIDPVGSNRYGPALFVVGNVQNQPSLAFTQAVIAHQDYEVYCSVEGQCQEEANQGSSLIDLKEVEDTVSDYNAYCQMSGACDKIDSTLPKKSQPLTQVQIQSYAAWLSKVTGYRYHQPSAKDIAQIQDYFQACVKAQVCPTGLLQSVELLLNQPDLVLVREVRAG